MSTEETKALLRQFFDDLFTQGKLEIADEIVAASYVNHNPAPGETSGREGLKQFITTLRTAFPDIVFTVEDQVAEGEKVTTRFTLNGTHQAEFAGIPGTGKPVTVTAINIHRVAEGQIQEGWLNWDALGFMQQLGVIPVPGQAEGQATGPQAVSQVKSAVSQTLDAARGVAESVIGQVKAKVTDVTSGSSSSAETQGDIRQAIEAANQQFMQAFSRGDAAGLAALYSTQGQALPPNGSSASGAPAIQAIWQGAMDAGIRGARLETLEVEGQGETAYEVGRYALSGDGGQTLDVGKYIVIWKREGGQWKLHRDIWNSNGPMA
jgi:steroid delta-isomerase-like uncharacterized protein